MSARHRALAPALSVLAAVALACSSAPVHLSEHAQGTPAGQGRELTVQGCGFQLAGVIPMSTNTRQLRAYNKLVRLAGDSVITDVRVSESWYWAFVGNGYCTQITATVHPRSGGQAR